MTYTPARAADPADADDPGLATSPARAADPVMAAIPARASTPDQAAESGRRQPPWLTVAIREMIVKLTDRAFIIGILSTLGLVIAVMAASWFFNSRPSTTVLVVTSQQAATVGHTLDAAMKQANENNVVQVSKVDDPATARNQVADGTADAYLAQVNGHWVLTWKSEPKREFEVALGQVLMVQTLSDLAARAGTTPEEVNQQMTFSSQVLQGSAHAMAGYFVGVSFAVLFMMSSMLYGMQIATSVIEEKQSRIVEILVSAIPVRHLLAGKVVGNTVIAFAQMALLLGAGMIGLSFTPLNQTLPNLPSAIGWFLVFFLAGFLALACVWAAAGALGTRSEDLQHTSQPLTWVLMATYVVGFSATGTAKVILSFVPILSSILMPVRLVDGTTDWWEPVLALAINLVFAAGMVLLGERIYRRALLRTHGRLSFRQALRLKD